MGWNDLIGRQLGQYTILEEIGRGGSSRVYRGFDAGKQRDVAIKVIPNDAEDRVGFVRRFEREVQAVAQLNHPNIVTVFDRGETDDLVYLVMQCVMGGTLRQRLGRPLPATEAAGFVVQMAQALHHAHLRGIVHRDVKPSNMLLDAENPQHVLLTDFGIAKLQGARGLTKTGTTIGTPEYMAPEQAEGKETDPRADVYSLGCVLYEALSGRPPFVGSTPVSVLYQQVHSRPAYIRGFNPDVPRELTRILDLALAKRPEERFGTAESLAQALLPFADVKPGSGALPPTSGSLRPPSSPLPERGQLSGNLLQPGGAPPLAGPPPLGSLSGSAGLALPTSGSLAWNGLGGAGLDDLFPNDPETVPTQQTPNMASSAVPPATPTWMSPAQPGVAQQPQLPTPTIPLPAFRLPARPSRPLEHPDISSNRHSLDALAAQAAESNGRSGAASSSTPLAYESPFPDATWHTMFAHRDGDTGQQLILRAGSTGPLGRSADDDEPTTSLREALMHTGEHRVPRDIWRPAPEEAVVPSGRRGRRQRRNSGRRPLIAGAALVAVLALSVVTWVGISASGLGITLSQGPHAQTPKPAATKPPTRATVAPTATTAPATATATTNPRQALDQQAAASFRAVTLTTFADGGCADANTKNQFTASQYIYINLCTASSGTAAPMSVVFKQNGQVMYTLQSGQYISPGSVYWYSRSSIPAGSYDAVVTLNINGTEATARDIPFTVG